jgi:UDP-glucuronate 4-epimerase
MRILVTGCAGFIGMSSSEELLIRGFEVVGIDNLNHYYSVNLKNDRLKKLSKFKNFTFIDSDITSFEKLVLIFQKYRPSKILHLAAQPGVRFSIENPQIYVKTNVVGFLNILECARNFNIEHLIYASSSSVYGANEKQPFAIDDKTDSPLSIYAATKKSNELMAHSYSHLFGLRTSGLRFFTVYGPWGRPDMSPWLFTESICSGKPINIFNNGDLKRDFTYISDAVRAIQLVIESKDIKYDQKMPFSIYNVGNGKPEKLMDFIGLLELSIGRNALKNYMDMQKGDVYETYADISDIQAVFEFNPKYTLKEGVPLWCDWYGNYLAASIK